MNTIPVTVRLPTPIPTFPGGPLAHGIDEALGDFGDGSVQLTRLLGISAVNAQEKRRVIGYLFGYTRYRIGVKDARHNYILLVARANRGQYRGKPGPLWQRRHRLPLPS